MAFTKATFDVHRCYQNLSPFPLPYKMDEISNLLTVNTLYNRPHFAQLRYAADLRILIIAIFLAHHIPWLYRHCEQNMDQVGTYVVILDVVLISCSIFYTFHKDMPTVVYTNNQMLQMQPKNHLSTCVTNILKMPSVYGLATGTVIITVGCSMVPFYITYCPIQVTFGTACKTKFTAFILCVSCGIRIIFFTYFSVIAWSIIFGAVNHSNLHKALQFLFYRQYKKIILTQPTPSFENNFILKAAQHYE